MKTKIGMSLLACSLILSTSPLPLVLADTPTNTPTETATMTKDSQNTPTENSTIATDDSAPDTDLSQTETPETVGTLPTEEGLPDEAEVLEDDSDHEGQYDINELLQQAQRDAAIELADPSLSSFNARSLPHTTKFINSISGAATKLAATYNIYASVMIAQAALESNWGRSTLGLAPNYNLFGIKGDYKGQSVTMRTWEVVNGQTVWIDAKFRKYPNYQASLEDNAKLLRYGLNYNPQFYNGAWKENTNSYKDATKWLTGRYATDPDYNTKLDSTIAYNQLTQFDYPQTNANNHTIKTSVPVSKGMRLSNTGYYVYSAPFNTPGSFRTSKLDGLYATGDRVDVTTYATTSQGVKTYYIKNVGWVDYRAVADFATVNSQVAVNKTMLLKNLNFYVYSHPFNTDGAKRVTKLVNKYSLDQQVTVTAEATTSEGVKVRYIDKVGWVDERALTEVQELNKQMRINNNGYYFYTAPYNSPGASRISQIRAQFAVNAPVTATKYVVTSAGVQTYYLNGYGWVDYRAVKEVATISQQNNNRKQMRINNSNYYFYNAPFNTLNAARTGRINEKLAKNAPVTVTTYAVTNEGVRVYQVEGYGWVDERALKDVATFKVTSSKKKQMRINNSNYYIYNAPYNTLGAVRGSRISTKLAKNALVTVTKYATTTEGVNTYYLDQYGWVDERALKEMATFATPQKMSVTMRIKNNGYNFYSAPFNTAGATRKGKLNQKLANHAAVKVTKYAVTSEGVQTYYLEGYGWVDYRALKDVATITSQDTHKIAMRIKNNGYYFYSAPFNTAGAERISPIRAQLAQNAAVVASKYAVTSEGVKTYYLVGYGWVDHRAVQ